MGGVCGHTLGRCKLTIWQEEEEEVDEDWDEVLYLHRPHLIFGDESLFDVLLSSTVQLVYYDGYNPGVEEVQAVGRCSFVGSQES
jgi:hypothetical protein